MDSDPRRVAVRIGFEPATIGGLQSHGHLPRLALTEAEIRGRLYRAHCTYLQTKGEPAMDVTIPSERRAIPNVIALLAAAAIGAGATAGAYQAFGASPGAGSGNPSAHATTGPTTAGDDGCVMTLQMHPC
jgi:hypothetical protein